MLHISRAVNVFRGAERVGLDMDIDNAVVMLGRDDLRQRFVFEVLRHAEETDHPIRWIVQRFYEDQEPANRAPGSTP